jgi:hypothetical protein
MRTVALWLMITATAFAHRTAQEAAEASARGGLSHRGGHSPFAEGLGCASTPERAFRSCCYANSSNYATVDVGLAQGRNGLWVCCRRYLSKSRLHLLPGYLAQKGLKSRISNLEEREAYYKPKEEGDVPESEESPEEEKETTDEE